MAKCPGRQAINNREVFMIHCVFVCLGSRVDVTYLGYSNLGSHSFLSTLDGVTRAPADDDLQSS